MKLLLKLLAISAIVTPTSLSIVACGQTKTEPEVPTSTTDVSNLLKLAKEKVENELGILSKTNNIIKDNIFAGSLGQQLANDIEIVGDDSIITNDTVRNEFNKIIVQNMSDVINPALFKDPQLKPLFGNLNEKDILKVNTSKTVWTKNKFDWSDDGTDKFGIAAADYKDYIKGTTFWYKMTVTISYDITYKDNNDKTQTRTNETADYTLYYANQAAKVGSIVDVVTAKFKDNIKNYLLEIDLNEQRMNFYDDFASLIGKLKTAAITKLEGSTPKITPTINDSAIDNQKDGNLADDANNAMGFNTTNRTDEFKSYSLLENNKVDFQKKYQALLTKTTTNYTEKLNAQIAKWKTDDLYKNITLNNPEKVVFYGNYILNNWSYQDLTLTSIYIPMVVKINTSVTEEITNVTSAMANLIASDGALKDKIKNTSAGEEIELKMNKADFEMVKSDDSTIGDAFDYISKKIIANNNSWFKDTTNFKFSTMGDNDNILNIKLSSIYKDGKFFTEFYEGVPLFTNFNINGFNFYLSKTGYNNIKKISIISDSNNTTWPN